MTLGSRGEDVAADYMRENGYRVIERNWRCKNGELDLICTRGKELVFVEVKTRGENSLGRAGESLTPAQQARLAKAASRYLSRNGLWSRSCRFDLIALEVSENNVNLEHVANVIDFGQALGGGHSSWQPW